MRYRTDPSPRLRNTERRFRRPILQRLLEKALFSHGRRFSGEKLTRAVQGRHAPLACAVNIITRLNSGHRTHDGDRGVLGNRRSLPSRLHHKLATRTGGGESKAFASTCCAEDWSSHAFISRRARTRFKSRDWTRLATGSPVLIDALVCAPAGC